MRIAELSTAPQMSQPESFSPNFAAVRSAIRVASSITRSVFVSSASFRTSVKVSRSRRTRGSSPHTDSAGERAPGAAMKVAPGKAAIAHAVFPAFRSA
jgi:hypothetical protein